MPDYRSREEKLRAMASQKTQSPHEAAIAERMLKEERAKQHPLFSKPGHVRHFQFQGHHDPQGRTEDVLDSFIAGRTRSTRKANVPGEYRVSVHQSADEEDATDLFSYNTVVARRHGDETISVNPKHYSMTTSRMKGKLRRRMEREGYSPSGEHRSIRARVPGRWGGWGPAWHPTGWEDLPFVHHHKPKKIES